MLSDNANGQIYGRFIPANSKKVPVIIDDYSVSLRDYQIEYINRILQSDDNAED